MKQTKGKANPKLVNELLKKKLKVITPNRHCDRRSEAISRKRFMGQQYYVYILTNRNNRVSIVQRYKVDDLKTRAYEFQYLREVWSLTGFYEEAWQILFSTEAAFVKPKDLSCMKFKTIEWKGDRVRILDQRRLPQEVRYLDCRRCLFCGAGHSNHGDPRCASHRGRCGHGNCSCRKEDSVPST